MSKMIKTGVSDYGMKPSCEPSGNVVTDGKMTTVPVPSRTSGANSIPEVTLDQSAGLPSRSGGGK